MKRKLCILLIGILLLCSLVGCSAKNVEKTLKNDGFYAVEGEKGMFQKDDAILLNTPSMLIVSVYPEQSVGMVTMIQEFDSTIIIYSLSCESTYMIQKILYKDDDTATSELLYDYATNSILSEVVDSNNQTHAELLNTLRVTYEAVEGYFAKLGLELKDFSKTDTKTQTAQSNEAKLIQADFEQDSQTGAYVKMVDSYQGTQTYYTIMVNPTIEGENVMVVDELDPVSFNYVFNFSENYTIFNITTQEGTVLAEGIYDLKAKEYTYYAVMQGYEQHALTKQEQNETKLLKVFAFAESYLTSVGIDIKTL